MSTLTKVLIVLVAVFSIALSVLFVASAGQWRNGEQLAQDYLEQRNAALAEKQQVETVLTLALAQKDSAVQASAAARDDTAKRLEDTNLKLREVRGQLAQSENRAASAEAGRKKLEEIVGVQTSQLTSLERQNQTLLTENIDLQTRNQQIASRNYEITSELTIRDDELRNLKERLAGREGVLSSDVKPGLPSDDAVGGELPANVGRLGAAAPATNLRGEVVEVAGNYASINIGESSGIEKGMVAMVFRGQQYLGDLNIETVRPRESGGKITTRVGDIRSGDRVQVIRR